MARSRTFAAFIAAVAGLAGLAGGLVGQPQPSAAQAAPDGPELTVDPAEVGSLQAPDQQVTHELTLGNAGDTELPWRVVEDTGAQRRLPRQPVTPLPTTPPDPGGRADLQHFLGLEGDPRFTVEPELPPVPEQTLTFTHSEEPAIVPGASVACGRHLGLLTKATGYLRHFALEDFGITADLDVTSVSFGVQSLFGLPQTLTVNLFTMADPAGLLRYDNLSRIGTADARVGTRALTMVQVPVTGTAPAGSTLVVEVAAPDMLGGFYLGAHPDGQTAPSYLRAEACGLPEPASAAELGFPEMQILLDVTGETEVVRCDAPGGTPWLAAGPLAGAIPPGGQQAIGLTFDSTGLPDGEVRSANLCLASADPHRPFLPVPLTLRVDQRCGVTIVGVHPEPLTVTDGVTCLAPGARVEGALNVLDGAGLVAAAVVVQGPLATFGATTAELARSQVIGPVSLRGTTASVSLSGSQVVGSVSVVDNRTGETPIVISDNMIVGSLLCTRNAPAPVDGGAPNTVVGGQKLDQCAEL